MWYGLTKRSKGPYIIILILSYDYFYHNFLTPSLPPLMIVLNHHFYSDKSDSCKSRHYVRGMLLWHEFLDV